MHAPVRLAVSLQTALLLVLAAGSGISDVDGQISWLHPRPTAGDIYSMHWLSPTHGWLISSLGDAIETLDGGQSFQTAELPQLDELCDIFFLDGTRGWIAGEYGYLYETTDGGDTWTLTDISSDHLRAVEFLDETYGTVVGDDNLILRTNDGGTTWTPQGSPVSGDWRDVHFIDWLTGWVVGSGGIIYTNSAGAFWEQQVVGNYYGLDFLDDSTGWAVGAGGTVSHTTDGGQSWSHVSLGDYYLSQVDFWSETEGWISGEGYVSSGTCFAYHTTDGGMSWDSDTFPSPFPGESGFDNGYEIVAVGPGQAYWSGNDGLLWATDDGAASWEMLTKVASPDDVFDVYFIDTMRGWAASGDYVIYTEDGGATWEDRSPDPEPTQLYCVYFMDNAQFGWVAGQSGYLARTTTGGTTWTECTTGVTGYFNDIEFNSNGFGVACGSNGALIQSDDYGVTWEEVPGLTSQNLEAVDFASESSGFVAGVDILRFDMTGDSWCNLNSPHEYITYDLCALSEDTVYASVGDPWTSLATYMYTYDGGDLWVKKNIQNISADCNSIFFADANLGFMVAFASKLLYTVDGGSTWQEEAIYGPMVHSASTAFFLDEGHAWIPGMDHSGILGLLISTTGVGEEQGGATSPGLVSVFPNPSSSGIPIVYFRTTLTGEYRIAVHDLAGRLIQSRELGQLSSGEHQVPVLVEGADSQSLPTGLYFCTITGNGLESRNASFVVID
jgi:photosystem II stability/assembly factor-like uncharacterized protein